MQMNLLDFLCDAGIEDVDLNSLVNFIDESKLSQKLRGFVNTLDDNAMASSMKLVHAFLNALLESDEDGGVLVTPTEVSFVLLNPAPHFREIIDEAQCVVLVGGTMSPISATAHQLFPGIPQSDVSTLSLGHVVPPENVCCISLGVGPGGKSLDFRLASRQSTDVQDELVRHRLAILHLNR